MKKRIIKCLTIVVSTILICFTFLTGASIVYASEDTTSSSNDSRFSSYVNLVRDATYYNTITVRTALNSKTYEDCDYIMANYSNKSVVNDRELDYSNIGFKINNEFFIAPTEISESGVYNIAVCRYYVENGISKPLTTEIETFKITVEVGFVPTLAKTNFYVEHYINATDFINDLQNSFENIASTSIRITNDTALRDVYVDVYTSKNERHSYSLQYTYLNIAHTTYINVLSVDNVEEDVLITDREELLKDIEGKSFYFNIANIQGITSESNSASYLDSFLKISNRINGHESQKYTIEYNGNQVTSLPTRINKINNVNYQISDSMTNTNLSLSLFAYSYPFENLYNVNSEAFIPQITFSNDITINTSSSLTDVSTILTNNVLDKCIFVNLSDAEQGYDYSFPSEYYQITALQTASEIGSFDLKYQITVTVPTSTGSIIIKKTETINVNVTNDTKPKILSKYNRIILEDLNDLSYRTEQIKVINVNGDYVTNVNFELVQEISNGFIIVSAIDTDGSEVSKRIPYVIKAKDSGLKQLLVNYGNFLRSIF